MDATITIKINPREAVPHGAERVPWLEKYGPPPEEAEVQITASLAEWYAAGATIRADGGVGSCPEYASRGGLDMRGEESSLHYVLVNEALRLVRETGSVPEALSADFVRELARDRSERAARETAERAAREEAYRRDREAREAAYAAEQESKARAAKERAAAVRDLVTRYGSANQRARLEEGLLPESEVIDLLADVALAGMGDTPIYERIQYDEIEHDDECEEPDYQSWAGAPESMSADDYDRASAVRARLEACRPAIQDALPGAELQVAIRVHRVWCDNGDCGRIERYGVRARVTYGHLTAVREYAI